MKIQAFVASLTLGAIACVTSMPVDAQQACPSFICMAGLTQGKGIVSGCSNPIQDFFSPSLYVYDEEGIDWPATALNRMRFLMQCPGTAGSNTSIVSMIIARYGTSTGA